MIVMLKICLCNVRVRRMSQRLSSYTLKYLYICYIHFVKILEKDQTVAKIVPNCLFGAQSRPTFCTSLLIQRWKLCAGLEFYRLEFN